MKWNCCVFQCPNTAQSLREAQKKKKVSSPLCNGLITQDQRSTLWLWALCGGSEERGCASGEDNVCLQTKIASGLRCKYSPSASSPLTVRWWPLTSPPVDEAVGRQLMTCSARFPLFPASDWCPGSRPSGVPLGLHAAGRCLVFPKALWRERRSQGMSIQEAWVWRLLWRRLISQMHFLSRGKHKWVGANFRQRQTRRFQKRLAHEFLDILGHENSPDIFWDFI